MDATGVVISTGWAIILIALGLVVLLGLSVMTRRHFVLRGRVAEEVGSTILSYLFMAGGAVSLFLGLLALFGNLLKG